MQTDKAIFLNCFPLLYFSGVTTGGNNNMGAFIDLKGQKFEKLSVIKRVESRNNHTMWLCKCDCGKQTVVNASNLKRGHTQSCGCLNIEKPPHKLHGKRNTPLYDVWCNIKQRCYNKNNNAYEYYGAENKTVCDEWLNDFQAFYNWAMQNGYKEGLTIERIDGNIGYTPKNCRWATKREQANNRRTNHFVTYNGETHTMAEWARIKEINYNKLKQRINKLHWNIEKALNTP